MQNFMMAAALAALLALAGCASTQEMRVRQACIRSEISSPKSCSCFARTLRDSLTEEQFAAIANAPIRDLDDEAAQAELSATLGVDGAMRVFGALKACGMAGQAVGKALEEGLKPSPPTANSPQT